MIRKGIICLILAVCNILHAEQQPAFTPSARPYIQAEWNVFLTADFIYWTVREDGLVYAMSGTGIQNPRRGHLHALDWSCDPGFKVGLGFNLPHDGWDIYSEYTWIHSDANDSTHQRDATAATSTLIPYWALDSSNNQLTDARANWDVTFNNLTLELARNSYLSQYFKLRFHAGLQGARINQDYHARYIEVDSTRMHLDLEQDFWGVGLRAGFNGAWQFIKTLSFFGDLSAATLWGQYDLHRHQTSISSNIAVVTLNTDASPHTMQPVIGLIAGVRWEDWLNHDRIHFLLQVGWEQQVWLSHNQMIKNFSDPNNLGNLILQGLVIESRFDF